MSRTKRPAAPMAPKEHRAAIIKHINQMAYGTQRSRIFRDFVAMAAIEVSNAVDRHHRDARNAQYCEIAKHYNKEDLARFPQMLAHVIDGLSTGPHDFLGQLYMEMEIANDRLGQCFTPYEISLLMARGLVDDDMKTLIADKGYATFSDPAVGGGAMIIAIADTLQDAGINYQQCMHVTAVDVDITAVHMSYIQMSLLYIPAVIVHGNTLTLEERSHWYTPAHVLGGWAQKLAMSPRADRVLVLPAEAEAETESEQHAAPTIF